MRLAVLFPFLAATLCLELACIFFVVYLKISRRPENLAFSLMALFLSGMIGFELLMQETDSLILGLFWYRLQFACVFLAIGLMLHFVSLCIGQPLTRRFLFSLLYPGAALLAVSAFHPLILHLPPAGSPPLSIDRNAPGPLFYPYALLSVAGVVLVSAIGLRGLKRLHRQKDRADGGTTQDFMPLLRHVLWIIIGILLIVLASVVEICQLLFITAETSDLPINPRAISMTLFCVIAAWALGREVFLTEQRKRDLAADNQFLDALTQFRLQTARDVQHEVKNKIAGIVTPLKVILLGLERGGSINLTERVSDALTEAQALENVVQTMLNMARMESGHAPHLEPKRPTEVFTLVEALCGKKERALQQERQMRLWRGEEEASLPHHRFYLSASLVHAVAPLHADTFTLILNNLLDNAVKYSPQGGDIHALLSEKTGELEIRISDTGIGIALEDQPRIFSEPFHRGRLAARAITGTGLGLNMVKRLLEAQGGRIEVASVLEEGSVFSIFLPWTPEEAQG